MLRVFKDLNIIYYIVSSGIGVLLALLLIGLGVNEIVAILIIALWIFVNAFLFNHIANKRAESIAGLRDRCKTLPFIAEYKKLLSKQKSGSVGDAMVRLNLAAGLLDVGEIKEAMSLMKDISMPKSRLGNISKGIAAVYHNNFSLAFLKYGEVELAKEALASCNQVLMDPKFPEREREKFRVYCNLRQAQIDIVSANRDALPAAESAFRRYYNNARTHLEKASGAYWLARICYMKGDWEEEERFLKTAADYGGDTIYSKEAKEILARYESEQESEYVQTVLPEHNDFSEQAALPEFEELPVQDEMQEQPATPEYGEYQLENVKEEEDESI